MLHHDKTGLLITLNLRSEALYWCNHHTNTHWQMGGFMGFCIGLTVMLGLNRWQKRQPNCRCGIMYMSRCLKKKTDLFHHLCFFCLKIDTRWKKCSWLVFSVLPLYKTMLLEINVMRIWQHSFEAWWLQLVCPWRTLGKVFLVFS